MDRYMERYMERYRRNTRQQVAELHLAGAGIQQTEKNQYQISPWEKRQRMEVQPEAYVAPELSGELLNKTGARILAVSGALTYIVSFLFIVIVCSVLFHRVWHLHQYIYRAVAAYAVCGIFYTLDAVLINHNYKKNQALYVVAWVLPFFYPVMRYKFIKHHNNWLLIGISMAMLLVNVTFGYTFWEFYRTYSAVYIVEDATQREMVRELMNQTNVDGIRFGKKMSEAFQISGVAAQTIANQKVIVLVGKGKYDMDAGTKLSKQKTNWKRAVGEQIVFEQEEKMVPTQLVFTKNSFTKEYRLSGVTINDTPILSLYIYDYWKRVMAEE